MCDPVILQVECDKLLCVHGDTAAGVVQVAEP